MEGTNRSSHCHADCTRLWLYGLQQSYCACAAETRALYAPGCTCIMVRCESRGPKYLTSSTDALAAAHQALFVTAVYIERAKIPSHDCFTPRSPPDFSCRPYFTRQLLVKE